MIKMLGSPVSIKEKARSTSFKTIDDDNHNNESYITPLLRLNNDDDEGWTEPDCA